MADSTVIGLTADTAPLKTGLMYEVIDPSGTPDNRKLTLEDFFKVISDFTADTTPTVDDLIAVLNDPGGSPAIRKVTLGNLLKTLSPYVQTVNTQTGAASTGTTTFTMGDTIPQNTDGDEYMTLAITPTSATNKLRIDVTVNVSNSSNNVWLFAGLFQDSTANALAAVTHFEPVGTAIDVLNFTHYMTSGTTSSTTFKVRSGASGAGTTTFNGATGTRRLGGVMASSITITEIRA